MAAVKVMREFMHDMNFLCSTVRQPSGCKVQIRARTTDRLSFLKNGFQPTLITISHTPSPCVARCSSLSAAPSRVSVSVGLAVLSKALSRCVAALSRSSPAQPKYMPLLRSSWPPSTRLSIGRLAVGIPSYNHVSARR